MMAGGKRPEQLRDGWQALQSWDLEAFLNPRLQQLALALLAVGLLLFFVPYRQAHGSFQVGWLDAVLVVPTLLIMMVLHELAHAGAILALGGSPRLGIAWFEGMPVPYATGNWVTGRRAFIVFAAAPAVVLTAGGLSVMAAVEPVIARQLYVLMSFNLSGAAADLVMAWTALRAPAGSQVHETKEVTAIYAPPDPAGPP